MQATREANLAAPYMLPLEKKDNKRLNALGAVFNEHCLKWIANSNIPEHVRFCDAGCGNGNFVITYKKQNPDVYCFAFDKDSSQIEQAKINAAEAGVEIEFAVIDLMDPVELAESTPGLFELIHTRFVLTHIQDQEQAAQNLWNRVAPGGRLLMLESSQKMGPNMETAPKCIQAFQKATLLQSQLQKTSKNCADKVYHALDEKALSSTYAYKTVVSDTPEKRSFYRRSIEAEAKLLDSKEGDEKARLAKELGYESGELWLKEALEWEKGDNSIEVDNVAFLCFRKSSV